MSRDDILTRSYILAVRDDATIRALAQRFGCSNSAALRIIIRDYEDRHAPARTLVDAGCAYETEEA
jgi:transposase-like protein